MSTSILKPCFGILGIALLMISCETENSINEDEIDNTEEPEVSELYFPPSNSDEWETVLPTTLEWNLAQETDLKSFLEESNTEGFIILKDGKIAVEWYFGDFTQDSNHTWNSAAKTLTAMTVGIAQQEGYLNLNESSSKYLGNGWSSMTVAQENAIRIKHHLSMTTGLDYDVEDTFCTDADCLFYKNQPNDEWYYHNAPYTLLDQVVSEAVEMEFKSYFNSKIRDNIGMQGQWVKFGFNNLYISNTRSMARFGLLCLNKGNWGFVNVLSDKTFFEEMTNTSQELNPSYGYLWWLNGKSSYKIPGSTAQNNGPLIPNAPTDLVAGLGANDQKLYVVPSQNLVIVRVGEDSGESLLGPSGYDDELWQKLNTFFNN